MVSHDENCRISNQLWCLVRITEQAATLHVLQSTNLACQRSWVGRRTRQVTWWGVGASRLCVALRRIPSSAASAAQMWRLWPPAGRFPCAALAATM